jgi:uncharacterized OB-fold protein
VETIASEQCPVPAVHGYPFRYCPYCSTWTEPVEVHAETLVQQWTRRALSAEHALDAIEAMLTKKKRMGVLFDVQQIRRDVPEGL